MRTSKFRLERTTGLVSIVSVAFLYGCNCNEGYFDVSALSQSSITMVLGENPVILSFTVEDSISGLCGDRDGFTYCTSERSFLFRDAESNLSNDIGSVTVTG